MLSTLRRAALILVCSTLAACAADQGSSGDGPGRDTLGHDGSRRPPRRLPNIFISPAGEPFRADHDAPYPVSVWFMQADADHDGRLSREEFRADALRFFDRLDEDHDGVIDGLELQDYEQKIAPEILPQIEGLHAYEGMDMSLNFDDPNNTEDRHSHGNRGGQGQQRPPQVRGVGVQGAAVYSLINIPEPVAAADVHFDGRISRQEFSDAADHRFDLLDKLQTGYLTLDKLPKTPLQAAILKQQKDARKREGRQPPPAP
jgi:Ca2+-binding EF-hand superfamily protein